MPARAFTAFSGLVLLAALFLPWYDFGDDRGVILVDDGAITSLGGTVSAWTAFAFTDILLATLAIAVMLLAFRRRAVFATTFAAAAVAVVALRLVWQPYDEIDATYGIWIALAAALGALVAARGIGTRGRGRSPAGS